MRLHFTSKPISHGFSRLRGKYIEQSSEGRLGEGRHEFGRLMLKVGYRTIGIKAVEVLLNALELRGEGDKHDEGSLAVADIVDLPLGNSVYISKGGRKVVFSHIMEGKIPEIEHRWA